LLIPAAALSVWYFLLPGPGHEMLVYVFVVPVLVLNMWEWLMPEILDGLLGKGKEKEKEKENREQRVESRE